MSETAFEIEKRDNGIHVVHFNTGPHDGFALGKLLESAAPNRSADHSSINVDAINACISQYGAAGIFEAENSWILRAHARSFTDEWARVYPSTQMLRFCMEVNFPCASMGRGYTFPYDWNHRNDICVETVEELFQELERIGDRSGASPQDLFNARVLGCSYSSHFPCEWLQLRSSVFDGPINIAVPETIREVGKHELSDPVIDAKIIWRETQDGKLPVSNAEAGLVTISHPDHLEYQDGTVGLVLAAIQLGIVEEWRSRYGFSYEHLPAEQVRKGSIPMEAPQVPLLAQISAKTILNHPDFPEFIGL